ncbi:unnamed protein product [Parajaminaea phylloscopi]
MRASLAAMAAQTQQTHKSQPSTVDNSPNMGSSEGWWEHVLPQGQLADRLRRAQHHPQTTTIGRAHGRAGTQRTPLVAFPSASPPEASSANTTSTTTTTASGSDEDGAYRFPSSRSHGSAAQHSLMGTGQRSSGSEQRARRLRTHSAVDYYSQAGLAQAMAHSRFRKNRQPAGLVDDLYERQPFGISGHQFLPMSATPEYSSEEDATRESSGLTRSQSVYTTTSSSRYQRRTTRSSHQAPLTSTHEREHTASRRAMQAFMDNNTEASRQYDLQGGADKHASGRRSGRRVSFDADAEAKARSDEEEEAQRRSFLRDLAAEEALRQTRARQAPASATPMDDLAYSGSQHWFNTTSSATTRRRRTRTLSKDGFVPQPSIQPRNGQRGVAASAPASPRSSIHLSETQWAQMMQSHGMQRSQTQTGYHHHQPRARQRAPAPAPTATATATAHEVVVLRSLHVAQDHIRKTTATALTYSRSLLAVPAPVLRPLVQVTLLWWVSSATVLALATCLCASYLLTVWDDMRGRKPASATSRGASVRSASSQAEESARPSRLSTGITSLAFTAMDSLVLNPLHCAVKVPVAVAKSLAPRAVPTPAASRRNSFCEPRERDGVDPRDGSYASGSQGSESRRASSGSHYSDTHRPKPAPLPPRPPLASLLPSMLLTLLIAIGAGLIGGWAKRRGGGGGGSDGVHAASPSLSTAPGSFAFTVSVDPIAEYDLDSGDARQDTKQHRSTSSGPDFAAAAAATAGIFASTHASRTDEGTNSDDGTTSDEDAS